MRECAVIKPKTLEIKWCVSLLKQHLKTYYKNYNFVLKSKEKALKNKNSIFIFCQENDLDEYPDRTAKNYIEKNLEQFKDEKVRNKNKKALVKKHRKTNLYGNRKSVYLGFAMIRIENNKIYIYEIHVEREYRSMGIGSSLLNYILSNYTGYKIILFVHLNNHGARKFYEKNNFIYDENETCKDSMYLGLSYNKTLHS